MLSRIYNNYLLLAILFLFPWELFKINFYYDLNFLFKLVVVFIGYLLLKLINIFLKTEKSYLNKITFAITFCYFLEASVVEFESIYYRITLLIIVFIIIIGFGNFKITNSILIFSLFFVSFTIIKGNYLYLKKIFHKNKIFYDEQNSIYANYKEKGLIIIFLDELSSLKYYENADLIDMQNINKFKNVFLNNNFQIFEKTFSNYSETIYSIPSVLNLSNDLNIDKIKKTHSINNIYINLKENLLFNNWKNGIHVFQDSAINFCEKNITKILDCNTKVHIPIPSTREFLVKNSTLKKVYDKFFYLLYFKLKKYSPETFYRIYQKRASKSQFGETLDKIIEISVLDEKKSSNLFFVHALTPHTPYTYKDNCSFGFVDNDNLNLKTNIRLHSHELKCLSKEFDKFFNKLNDTKLIDNFEIIIASDHGNRFENNFISQNSTFFAYKGSKYLDFKSSWISIQNLIPKIVYNEFKENPDSNNQFYNAQLNKFININ